MVAMRGLITTVATMAYAVAYGLDNIRDGNVKYLQPREITVTVTETICPAAPQYPPPLTTATVPLLGTFGSGTTPAYETIPGYETTPVETSSAPSTPIPVISTSSSEVTYPSVTTTGASDKPSTHSVSVHTETYITTSKALTTSSRPMTATMTPPHSTMVPPTSTSSTTLPASGGAGPESVNIGLLGLVAMAVLV